MNKPNPTPHPQVALHADLTMLAQLSQALARVRVGTVPLAA